MMIAESQAFDVTIAWNDLHQRITGFGACVTYCGNSIMNRGTTVLDQLFDTTTGAGLSIIRTEVGGGGENSGDYKVMQEAQKRGVRLFWAAPWAPPRQYVSTDNNTGNPLLPAYYQAYADYLSAYVQRYKSQYGIDFMGISVQNEPHFNAPWAHCVYTGAQIRDFIKNNLGPTFVRNGVKATIIMPESNWDQRGWSDPTLLDTTACRYTGVVALHLYQGNPKTPYPLAKQKGKELWESECSNAGTDIPGMAGAMDWVRAIHDLLTISEVNAYHYWWLYAGGSTGEGLVYPSGPTKRLWTLGNWSKFVRPGWRMIGLPSNYTTDSLVGISAFRDSISGKFAIVAVNLDKVYPHDLSFTYSGFHAASVTPWLTDETHDLATQTPISCAGGTFSATLPKYSVTSFVGMGAPSAPGDVRVDSLSVNSPMILAGQSAVLSWTSVNATSVTIDNGVGAVAASGTATVTPAATIQYTVTAQGPNGPALRRITVQVFVPRTPANPSPVVNGLDYKYYEGTWTMLPDFSALTPVKTGITLGYYLTLRNREDGYGFRYTGYLDAPMDAIYTFWTTSDDGNKFSIGDTLLINNDGPHASQERVGYIGLKAGKHPITMDFYDVAGTEVLGLAWKYPGIPAKQSVTINRYFRIGQPAKVARRDIEIPAGSRESTTLYDMHGRRAGQLADIRVNGPSARLPSGPAVFIAVSNARERRTCRTTIVMR
jgi:glucuronoarabinoxylan endo-1,4-beta-xylanase